MRHIPAAATALLLAAALSPASAARAADLPVQVSTLSHVAGLVIPNSLLFSPNALHMAYATKAGDLSLSDRGIFRDGQNAEPSPPGDTKVMGQPVRFIIDGKENSAFDALSPPVYSPDSRRLAYAGMRDGHWSIFVDGKTYDTGGDTVPAVAAVFSPDSQHVASCLRKNYLYHILQDKQPWPVITAADAGMLTFSPDSQHLAAVARIKGAWVLFIDGKPLPPPVPGKKLAGFGAFVWKPDSSGLAYYASFPGKHLQVYTTCTSPYISYSYDGIMKGTPVFSPDSSRLAFATESRRTWKVIAPDCHTPVSPLFQQIFPDSLCILAPDGKTPTLLYLAKRAGTFRLYIDNQPAPISPFNGSNNWVVSPDHRHYAFSALREGNADLVLDGRVIATYPGLGENTFSFSPDSSHLGYAAHVGNSWHVAVASVPVANAPASNAPAPALGPLPQGFPGLCPITPVFSPDSRHIAYISQTGPKQWRLVVGPEPVLQSIPFESIPKGATIGWSDPTHVRTVALRKLVAMRVEATLPK